MFITPIMAVGTLKLRFRELLDAESISDIKAIMRAGEMLAEPVTLFPIPTRFCGLASPTKRGDWDTKKPAVCAFLVTRKDGSKYVFKFDYDRRSRR